MTLQEVIEVLKHADRNGSISETLMLRIIDTLERIGKPSEPADYDEH